MLHEAHDISPNKKLMGFYNASNWAMEGECYLDVFAFDLTKDDENELKRYLEDLGVTFDVSNAGEIKGYFEGTYDRIFPVMRTLLSQGWSW